MLPRARLGDGAARDHSGVTHATGARREVMSPEPVTGPTPDFLPPYVSNGLIGLRVREIPLLGGVAIVNGLAGVHPEALVESVPYAPYPLGADIRIDGVWARDVPNALEFEEQQYDFASGELHSRFTMHVASLRARVHVLTFCSRSQPSLVLQEVTVEVDRACDLTLGAVLEPGAIAGRWAHRWHSIPLDNGEQVDGALRWEMLGELSSCGVAYATEFVGDADANQERPKRALEGALCTRYSFRGRSGRRYRLRQTAAMVPSSMHNQPDLQAARLTALGRSIGFEELRRENRLAWDELWQSRVHLVGADDRWQAMADAAFFYLQTSVHQSSPASTSIFGLAQWWNYHYYYGHIMWDIETFSIPPLLLTQPYAARSMLEYRVRGMEDARANARMWGYRGLQFPWESSPSTLQEAAPGAGDAASFEHHVSMSVALALAQYAYATGDGWYERDRTWPILVGVAEYIESRVLKTARGYEIRRALGIAETKQPHDNVAYVNMAASVVLRHALGCAERLGFARSARWRDIAEHLVVPFDDANRVILDHDDYDPDDEKGATPAVLAALFPFGYQASPEVVHATTEFYLAMADRYIGSPMLSALYGVWATRVGQRERARDLLEEGYAKFVNDRFMNTHEYRHDRFPEQPVAGPFFANLSGFLLGCMYGYPGIELTAGSPQEWARMPVCTPAGWDGIEIERIWVRGRPARLRAYNGDERARIEFVD